MHNDTSSALPSGHRRRPRRRRVRMRSLPFNHLIPNMLTVLGLCAGLNSMKFAMLGHFSHAVAALLLAACLDGLDGRVARLLSATSRFGAELDSLSDIICFGIVPPFILMMWALPPTNRFSFVPCVMFTVCMALRLARFNAALDNGDKPLYSSNFFTGVPAPAGAGFALLPVFIGLEAEHNGLIQFDRLAHSPWLAAGCLIVTALLLISTLPVWSFKTFKVQPRYIVPLLLVTGLYTAVLLAEPWGALAGLMLLYLLTLPFSRHSYWKLRRTAEAQFADKELSDRDAEAISASSVLKAASTSVGEGGQPGSL